MFVDEFHILFQNDLKLIIPEEFQPPLAFQPGPQLAARLHPSRYLLSLLRGITPPPFHPPPLPLQNLLS